jgi:hypothetical protein
MQQKMITAAIRHKYKLTNGLCSGWEIFDAQYDAAGAQLIAKLQSTGGLRLVFGLPEE